MKDHADDPFTPRRAMDLNARKGRVSVEDRAAQILNDPALQRECVQPIAQAMVSLDVDTLVDVAASIHPAAHLARAVVGISRRVGPVFGYSIQARCRGAARLLRAAAERRVELLPMPADRRVAEVSRQAA